jgi:serine/threonine protein kinase
VTLIPGANIGPYRVVEQIGRGGMATVYKAYQPSLARYVAIKVLPAFFAEQPGFSERFQQRPSPSRSCGIRTSFRSSTTARTRA